MALGIVTKIKLTVINLIKSRIIWILFLNILLIIIPISGLYFIQSKDYRELQLRHIAARDLSNKIKSCSTLNIDPQVLENMPISSPYHRILIVDSSTKESVYDTNWIKNWYILYFEYENLLAKTVANFVDDYGYPILKRREILERLKKYIDSEEVKSSIINYRYIYAINHFSLSDGSKYSSIVLVDKSDIITSSKIYKILLLCITLLSFIISIVISSIYYTLFVKPLLLITKEVELIKHFETVPDNIFSLKDRRDVIGQLSKAFYTSSQELINKKDQMETFTSDVLHELKNPLTGIRNGIEIIDRIEGDRSDKKEILSIISRESGRIEKLLYDIKEYSLFGQNIVSTSYCNPIEILNNLVLLYKKSNITLNIHNVDIPEIEISEDKFLSVLTNLIDNAIDFSPAPGSISIDLSSSTNFLILSVKDLGRGIEESEKSKIFNRFYSNRQKQDLDNIHSGLGLSIVKRVLEQDGHVIECFNNTPKGTAFRIKFNIKKP